MQLIYNWTITLIDYSYFTDCVNITDHEIKLTTAIETASWHFWVTLLMRSRPLGHYFLPIWFTIIWKQPICLNCSFAPASLTGCVHIPVNISGDSALLRTTLMCVDSRMRNLPSWSASCLPRSVDTTLSSSRSHLLPTSTTWALSHEYVLIWVHLQYTHHHWHTQNTSSEWI